MNDINKIDYYYIILTNIKIKNKKYQNGKI